MVTLRSENNFFVVAAVVAAELEKAQKVAQQITLTAGNARALAQRAGKGAAGFRAITNYIDELASKTVQASRRINGRSITIIRLASEYLDTEYALEQFERAYDLAGDAAHIRSVDPAWQRLKEHCEKLRKHFEKQCFQLNIDLEELAGELRTATVLSAMSKVEASHSGKEHEQSLNVIASNVANAANEINFCVKKSRRLFSNIVH